MTMPETFKVIEALVKQKNVLLYGPPGTGKTKLVSEVVAYLRDRATSGGRPTLKLGSESEKFGTATGAGMDEDLPEKLAIEWITFHQGYSYEEFIIGKRPQPKDGGLILQPHFGILMSIAVNISLGEGTKGCLIIIDEINRANTSQVFGEFITLLDFDYRSTINGVVNNDALKIRLPGIAYEEGVSEEIYMLRDGGTHKLPENWTFPEHIYILATMNSVDKAALPLDSALTRRFFRIEMAPSIELLAKNLNVNLNDLAIKARAIRNGDEQIDTLTCQETTVLLLDRLNVLIATDMGVDFELGHALVWKVVDAEDEKKWSALINAWDHVILPQLLERYAGRDEGLRELLKISPDSITGNVFSERAQIGMASTIDAPISVRPLHLLSDTLAMSVLRQVAI